MRSAIDYSRESINRGTDFGGSVAMAGGCVGQWEGVGVCHVLVKGSLPGRV